MRFCEHCLFNLISTCYDRHIEHITPTAVSLMRVKVEEPVGAVVSLFLDETGFC